MDQARGFAVRVSNVERMKRKLKMNNPAQDAGGVVEIEV